MKPLEKLQKVWWDDESDAPGLDFFFPYPSPGPHTRHQVRRKRIMWEKLRMKMERKCRERPVFKYLCLSVTGAVDSATRCSWKNREEGGEGFTAKAKDSRSIKMSEKSFIKFRRSLSICVCLTKYFFPIFGIPQLDSQRLNLKGQMIIFHRYKIILKLNCRKHEC